MAAYYNEIEPYAAAWLRNLIAKGLLPDGEVDERSIVDVRSDELRGFAQAHFFAGVGGWPYALRLAGWPDDRPVWTGSCPCQPFSVAGKGLGADDPRHLWPHFHRLIAAVRPPVVFGEQVAGAAGYGWLDGVRSDLAEKGYACEAFDIPACAVDAPHIRSRLYWVASALDHANNPRLEGHAGHEPRATKGWGEPRRSAAEAGVCGDMADSDSVGRADERRARLWRADVHDADGRGQRDGGNMADADLAHEGDGRLQRGGQQRRSGRDPQSCAGRNGTFWSDAIWLTGADGKSRRAQPGLPLLAHGIPARVGRLRAYGNAIVPQLAAEVIAAFMDVEAS